MPTSKSKADLTTDINTNIPDNVAGLVSPLKIRTILLDILESSYNRTDDQASFLGAYGYKIVAGQLSWTGAAFDTLDDASNDLLNSGGTVTTASDKIQIDADPSVDTWVAYFAQLNAAWGESYNLHVTVSGDQLSIFPKIGSPKIEYAQLEYDSGSWGLLAGGGSSMTISASSDSQITLGHENCGFFPPWLTARDTDWILSSASGISATSTVVNIRDSSGATFTPTNGDRISVARLAQSKSLNKEINPDTLTNAAGRIVYFGIYKPS